MAIEYFPTSQAFPFGIGLASDIATLQQARRNIKDKRDVMIQMLGGADQNTAVSFALVTARFGYTDDATSMGAFHELDAGVAAVETIGTTLDQLASRFRLQ
jgi:hypothetical protein